MIQARKSVEPQSATGEVLAFPARSAPSRAFGRRAEPERWSLVVDLAAEPLGLKWFRGAATLAGLCATALMLSPGLDLFADEGAGTVPQSEVQLMAFAPLADADPAAAQAQPVVQPDGKPVPATTAREGNTVRVSGHVSDGLYWSLREAGVSPQTAADYLRAINQRIDVGGDVAPFDRFDLVFARTDSEALLYAALHRSQGDDVQLVKWNAGGKTDWFDASGEQRRSDQLMAPVAGRVTSRFGSRVHPIFRYSRFHSGVDFSGTMGSPVVAAADGQVVGTGWSGGYGRQVRVAHGGGVLTTYSHLSGFAAAPGTPVRQGEVIGYVGSSGVSTGPHLHFEVRVGGRPVDPLSARLVHKPVMQGRELAAFEARVKQLTSIGRPKG